MDFPVVECVILGIGCILLAVWLVIYAKSLQYASLFDSLEEKAYPLKELYCVGYGFLEMIHYSYKTEKDRKLRERLEVLYEPKYADYYLRVTYAQKISIAYLVALAGFIYFGFAPDIAIFGIFMMFTWLAYYYFGTLTDERIKKRQESMMNDFSEVVSKLALLTNAGMILREAWEMIAFTGETDIYQEMQKTLVDMKNGLSDSEAIRRFGLRCMLPETKKFASTVVQGIEKGNRDLSMMLQQQSNEVWEMKKHWTRRKAEQAASKLVIPMMIMFVGILIMIIIPVFTNIGM